MFAAERTWAESEFSRECSGPPLVFDVNKRDENEYKVKFRFVGRTIKGQGT